jgi:formylglycine-generating enzyme required for sulfatase activity
MGNNPSGFSGPNKPVELVSWEDAQDFIGTLNASVSATGGPYRLPTESEWEYAYRAKTATRFYWGGDSMGAEIGDYAWYYGNSGYKTHKVGQKLPNSWGLYDMAGGVFEWCKDWYGDYPAGPVTDPQGAGPNLGARVVRGGCWKSFPLECRAAMRGGSVPDQRFTLIGFRLVRTED